MYKQIVKIVNDDGLHARPASVFVLKAKQFESDVTIERANEGVKYNAKSLMKLLVLGAVKGDEIIISADGNDEEKAAKELAQLISNGCGE